MERAKDGNSITIHKIDNVDDLGPEISGTVVSNFGTQVDVEANDGDLNGKIIRCHMRSNLDPLVTGDKVIWRFAEPYGVVVARIDRYSELIRPDAYGKLRPVAANVDVIAWYIGRYSTPVSLIWTKVRSSACKPSINTIQSA